MAVQRIWVDPTTYRARLLAIPDDGLDYEIIFDGGVYDFIDPALGYTAGITIDHRSGGLLTLRGRPTRETVFACAGNVGRTILKLIANRVHLHGIAIYETPWDTPEDVLPKKTTIEMGAILSPTGAAEPMVQPQELFVTDCYLFGHQPVIRIYASRDPRRYTDVRIVDNEAAEIGAFSPFAIQSDAAAAPWVSTWSYAHVVLDHNRSQGVNGWGWQDPPTALHHNDGTLFIDTYHLGGTSTFLETRSRFHADLYGTPNHDMHCERINQLGPEVVATWRDCYFSGTMHAGAIVPGSQPMWLWYHHTSPFNYTDPTHRPNLYIENCRFVTKIDEKAGLSAIRGMSGSTLCQVLMGHSVNGHIYDSDFLWDLPQVLLDYPGHAEFYAVRLPPSNPNLGNLGLHNCVTTNCALSNTDAAAGVITTDDATLGVRDHWQREPTWAPRAEPTELPRANYIRNGSFEDGYTPWSREQSTTIDCSPSVTPPHGSCLADMWAQNGSLNDPTWIRQDVTDSPGTATKHTFSFMFNPYGGKGFGSERIITVVEYSHDLNNWTTIGEIDSGSWTNNFHYFSFEFTPAEYSAETRISMRIRTDNRHFGLSLWSGHLYLDVVELAIEE